MKLFKKIIDNKDFSEVFKKGGVALLIRIIGFLCGYLFIYYTVNLFGSETQGRLAISFSFMIILSLLCRMGIDTHFVKVFAIENNLENAKGIYFKLVRIVFPIALLISVLMYCFSEFIANFVFQDNGLAIFLKWISPCILFYSLIVLNASVFRGLKKNTLYSILFNGSRFFVTLCLFAFFIIFFEVDNTIVAMVHCLAIFFIFIWSFIKIKSFLTPFHRNTKYKTKSFVKESLPMLFSASMIILLGLSDTIVLGIFKDSAIVGQYSVIIKIAAVTSFTFQAINSILTPKISSVYHSNDMKLFKSLIKYSTRFNFLISVIVVFGIILLNKEILGLFGEDFYARGKIALIILTIGQLFNAICGPIGAVLQMTGYQKVFQNILFIAFIINISLNLILVKPYGVNGVAIATACSLAFWNITGFIFIRRKIY